MVSMDDPLTGYGEGSILSDFRYGRTYAGPRPVNVPIQYDGRRVAFNLAAFDMPVVTDQVARLVNRSLAARSKTFQ